MKQISVALQGEWDFLTEINDRAVGSAEQDQSVCICRLILLYTLCKKKNAWSQMPVKVFNFHKCLSLPNSKILALTKLGAFADDKVSIAKLIISIFDRVGNICGKRRKCCLPAFFSFSHKGPLLQGCENYQLLWKELKVTCKHN